MAMSPPLVSVAISELRACQKSLSVSRCSTFGHTPASRARCSAAADRIGQGRIAERELVVAIRVILMLARIPARLGELPVDAGAARTGYDGKDAVEHLTSRKILVEPE